jgi:glutathione synthase/RimK-type ligase-like ATP-grasp enzyme
VKLSARAAPFMPEILARIAPRLGAEVLLEPEFREVGRIVFPNGRQTFFWHNKFNLNSVSAARIAQDKGYAGFFLEQLGFCVPKTRTFFKEELRRRVGSPRGVEAGYEFALELGLPVFVKPCRRSQGSGVTLVDSRESYEAAARAIFERDLVLLVQEACPGRDYRFVVLDNEVISAYERVPLHVIGDGSRSIHELLLTKQREFDASGRDTELDLADPRIAASLRRQRLSFDAVLPASQRVTLLEAANLSCGGSTLEVTDDVHPTVAALAIRVSAALDLRFAGVDIILPDATEPLGEYFVLEINSAPGLDHYAGSGPEHIEAIDRLYEKVLIAIARGV